MTILASLLALFLASTKQLWKEPERCHFDVQRLKPTFSSRMRFILSPQLHLTYIYKEIAWRASEVLKLVY